MPIKTTPDEAVQALVNLPVQLKTQRIDLEDSWGRVLAEDIFAAEDDPPFDHSPFDGYALRAEDTQEAGPHRPVTLVITEEVRAGVRPQLTVGPGQAAKILTGAELPQGADAVIKFELTEFTPEQVRVFSPQTPWRNVIRQGENFPRGAQVARAGQVITAPLLGLLSSLGRAQVQVYLRPRAAIINTGSELIPITSPPQAGKIRNSNYYTLSAYLRESGLQVLNCGMVGDDPQLIAQRIKMALSRADVVITTGGASVGDYDYTARALELAGGELLFTRVALKRGGAMAVGKFGSQLVLGLSGNPGAAVTGLLWIALPYLRKLCGNKDLLPQAVQVYLSEDYPKPSPSLRLLKGHLELREGRAWFSLHHGQGSGSLSGLVDCDLLAEIPAGSGPLPAGTLVQAYRVRTGGLG